MENLPSCRPLAEAFYVHVLTDFSAEEEGEKQAHELVEMFRRDNPDNPDVLPKITAHYCDVSDPASVDDCMAEILDKHGKIDHLVTSAGFTENFSAETYPY